jgi:hypothetical protein
MHYRKALLGRQEKLDGPYGVDAMPLKNGLKKTAG